MKQVCILFILLSFSVANSQSIEKETFASSGKLLTNANNQLNFTLGEPIVGNILTNAQNNIAQGFWNVATTITLSENDFSLDNLSITVFPNPIQNILTIKFDAVNQNYNMNIMDVNGRKLQEKQLLNGNLETTLNVKNLATGVYFLNIIQLNTNKRITYKLIKK